MTKFSDLKLDPKVLKAIAEAGYETPTPIQSGAIPPALEGRDVLGIAQTGTGKTASFTLPMITLLGRGRARARMPRSLVLCPTRELAAQVAENFETYAKHTRLTKALLIGGVSFGEQDKLIDRGVDVLIATPGRLLDHFERGKLLLTGVQIMVVDEADRMLDMGFIPDIERIFQLTPFTRQTLFFSATMAPEIERITDTFLHSPERIEVARQATTSETITQKLVEITPTRRDQSAKQKRELLRALILAEGEDLKNAIIFCNRKTDVDIVAKSLKAHGFDAAPIHGDLDQRHRMATLDEFREGKLRLLVASDVAARGLDIPAVSHVINFDLPSHAEDYVHRIGRTGRAGRTGTAISIGTPSDDKLLNAIETLVKQSLPRAQIPEGFALTEAAQEAPRPRENGNRRERGRDRDRRGSRRHDGENRPPRHAEEKAAHRPAEQAERPARDERVREERPREDRVREERPRDEQPRAERIREERPRDERRERHHDRRDDRRDRGDRSGVLGLGEHMPEFMTRSFRPRFIEQDHDEAATAVAEAPAQVQAEVTTDAPPAEKPARSSKRTARKPAADPVPTQAEVQAPEAGQGGTDGATDDVASTPAPEAVTAAPPAEAAPAVEAPAVEASGGEGSDLSAAAQKPARKPRAPRKTKKAEATEPAATGDTAMPAEAGTEGNPEAATEPAAAKPKRKSPAKKAAATDKAADIATEATPEPKAAKPRAPRKPRAKAAAPVESPAQPDHSAPEAGADDKAEA